MLEMTGLRLLWPNYRIEVAGGTRVTAVASYISAKGEVVDVPLPTSPHMEVFSVRRADLFQQREPFSLYKLMTKPMHLMIVGSVVMIWLLPKMRVRLGC